MPEARIPELLARAIALHRRGSLSEAEPLYRRVLAGNAQEFDALHMLGVIALQRGRHGEALELIRQALALRPNSAWAQSNLGVVLRALKRGDEAVACFERALALNGRDPDVLNNLSSTLFELKRYGDALSACERALALEPESAEAFNHRGNALQETGRLEEALASYDRSLAVNGDFAEAWHNRGGALQALNRHREAIESYERALALRPDYADAHWNESLARLCLGDFETGLAKYEWRWRTSDADPARRELPQPLWLGEQALSGKTILLHAEQGIGDCLQFVRYAALVAGRGATVVLAVHREVKTLLAPLAPAVFGEGELLPACDLRCPLASLPLAFRTSVATIPAEVPYLHPDAARLARWNARLARCRSPRVGLAWAGNPAHKNDRRRSIAFERLAPMLAVRDVQYVSLQKEPAGADAKALRSAPVLDLGAELEDFADTAAVVANLDLVVTVDTALAHLAGAMGKPVWILLPFACDWRWLIAREDSPWYPTASLFRQPQIDDWASVITRVAAQLARAAASRAAGSAASPPASCQSPAGG